MRASLARDANGISRLEAALAPHHRRVHRLGLGRGPGEGRGRRGGAEAVVVAARADEVTRGSRSILSGGLQSGSETISYQCMHVSRVTETHLTLLRDRLEVAASLALGQPHSWQGLARLW